MRAWVLLSAVLWYLTGGGAPPARPPGFPQLPGPASQLRPAPLQSELRLRFHLVSGLFFFFFFPPQLDGSVIPNALRKASFMASRDTQVMRTSSLAESIRRAGGPVALLRFFPSKEMEQKCIERLLCALHFLEVVSSL